MRRRGRIPALILAIAWIAPAADNPAGAARELARKVAQFAGRSESVTVAWRNQSSLSSEDLTQFRLVFESAARDAGTRTGEAGVSLQITLTETATDLLAVAEGRRGEERQVWIASWPKTNSGGKSITVRLEKTELWRQPEPILDAAAVSTGLLALTASNISLLVRSDDHWTVSQSVPVTATKPRPRDLRGKLRINGSSFQAFLPGVNCNGVSEPALTVDCKASDLPWLIESGKRSLLYANWAADRNYFDGRIVTQTGARKTVPPFYTAAAADDEGRAGWVFALTDGRAQIVDASFEPLDSASAAIGAWGSDIAGVDARCFSGSLILATKPGAGEPDAIQAYRISGRSAEPVGPALDFVGPVTALWTSDGGAAFAVAKEMGAFVAYSIAVSCGS